MASGDQAVGARPVSKLDSVIPFVAAAVILAAVLVPIWRDRLPPLVDYPTHAARAFVLSRPAGSGGVLDYYSPDWIPVPNLGVDLVLSTLMRFTDPWTASCLFLSAVVVVLLGGGIAWARSLGAPWPMACLPAIALGDTWYRMGFVNYVLGIGIAAWAMAAWVRWRGLPPRTLVARGAAVAAGLAVVHLLAALVFVLIAAAYAWFEGSRRRPVAAWAWWAVPAAFVCSALALAGLGKTPWNWHAKLLALQGLGRWFGAGPPDWNSQILGGLLLAGLALIFATRAAPRLVAWTLAAGAALGPSFAGGTAFSSERLTLPMMLVLAVHAHQTRLRAENVWPLMAIVALLTLNQAEADVAESDRGKAALATVRRHVRLGDTVFTFEFGIPERPTTSRAHLHFADWLVFDGVFVPQLFAKPGQQPLRFMPAAAPFKQFQGQEPLMRLPGPEDAAAASRLQSGLANGRHAYILVFGLRSTVELPWLQAVDASETGKCALYRVPP